MVGDSLGDIEMARGAGAAGCIGICWNKPAAAHLQAADVAIANSMKSKFCRGQRRGGL